MSKSKTIRKKQNKFLKALKYGYKIFVISVGSFAIIGGITTGNYAAAAAGISLVSSTLSSLIKDKEYKSDLSLAAKSGAIIMSLLNILGQNDGHAKNLKK